MRGFVPNLLAVLMTAATLVALAGYQVTNETAGPRLLGRLGSALIEIDRWLPAHEEDVQLLARDRRQSVIRISDLPVDVTLPASQVVDADEPTVRGAIVEAMGRSLYEQGSGAFRDDEGQQRALSVAEPVRWTASLLSEKTHRFWRVVLPVALLLVVAFAANAMVTGGSPLKLLLVGAGFAAVGFFATWLLATAATGVFGSAVDKEIALIVRDGAWVGLRDSLAVAVICFTLVALLSVATRQRHDPRSDYFEPPPDPSAA